MHSLEKRLGSLLSSAILLTSFSCAFSKGNITYQLNITDEGEFYLENGDKTVSLFPAEITSEEDLIPEKKDGTWYLDGKDTGILESDAITSSLHLGFDDYVWNEEKSTGYHCDIDHGYEIENTLSLSDFCSYSDYSVKSFSIASSPVALMSGYEKATHATDYSGQTLTSFSVETTRSGRLIIGTCKVRNAVNTYTDEDQLFITEKYSCEVNKGVNQIPLSFTVGEDETLTLSGDSELSLYEGVDSSCDHGCFAPDNKDYHDFVYQQKDGIISRLAIRCEADENYQEVRNDKSDKVMKVRDRFQGKTFSILGDSLSAFDGTCNNTEVSSHLADNIAYYSTEKGNITDESQMWYSQVADDFDMKLLVNNSCSGSTVIRNGESDEYSGYNRCMYLSPDNGEYKDATPDYIFILMGGNDCLLDSSKTCPITYSVPSDELLASLKNEDGYIEPPLYDFTSAYMMIVDKIRNQYPTSQIYIIGSFEIPLSALEDYWNALNDLNDNLELISQYFSTGYLCLRNNEGLKKDTIGDDLVDDYAHPDRKGFNFFSDEIEIELIQSALFSAE